MRIYENSLMDLKKKTTPFEFSETLKSFGPIFYAKVAGTFIVTDYTLAEQILTSPDYSADRASFFISRMPNMDLKLLEDFFGVVSKMMVMSDGEEHLKRRKLAGFGLNDRLLDYFGPLIGKTVEGLLNSLGTEFDFVTEIAEKLPSIVLADLFAIPEEARADFYRWSHNMTYFFGGSSEYRNEDGIEVNESAVSLRNFFSQLIKERKANPKADFLTQMLAFQEKLGISDSEMVSQAIMLLVAGQVTTTDQLCNNLYTLLQEPEIMRLLREKPEETSIVIEELNRLDPAVTFIFRIVKNDTVLGGIPLKAKDVVFISTHAVNRDPSIFRDPNHLLADRKHNPHMGFGYGPHFCLGAKLARIEMDICFRKWFQRFSALSLSSPKNTIRKHTSLAFSGFESLKVKGLLAKAEQNDVGIPLEGLLPGRNAQEGSSSEYFRV